MIIIYNPCKFELWAKIVAMTELEMSLSLTNLLTAACYYYSIGIVHGKSKDTCCECRNDSFNHRFLMKDSYDFQYNLKKKSRNTLHEETKLEKS